MLVILHQVVLKLNGSFYGFCTRLLYNIKMRQPNHWTDEEDRILMQILPKANCFQKWKYISELLKEKGIVKSKTECRDRYVNKLDPELRKDKLEVDELALLFDYYDEYGPLWSVFQSLIPGRNQNLLKNKFYSVLRSGIRLIYLTASALEKSQNKQKNFCFSLSSKLLVDIYEGKKRFRKFKFLIRKCFKALDFQHDEEKTQIIQKIFGEENLREIKDQIQRSNKTEGNNSKQIKTSAQKQDPKIHKPEQGQNLLAKNVQASSEIEKASQENFQMTWTPQINYFINPNPIGFFFPMWNPNYNNFTPFTNEEE